MKQHFAHTIRMRLLVAVLCSAGVPSAASDHLDAPTVIADPRADIGDLYAWMSPDADRLNLVMTIVGHSFSNRLDYVFHIDSARRIGGRVSSVNLSCRMSQEAFRCSLGAESVSGKIGNEEGARSDNGRLRAFAGLRDDPFFNNVRGTRDVYNVVKAELADGAPVDPAGCPMFKPAVAHEILRRWRSTDGAPASNFLKGWTPASIVISLDKRLVTKGGQLLGVWATTDNEKGQIDRAGRPLTGNALLATLGTPEESNELKERYNRAQPSTSGVFVAEIAKGVALYDGLDGRCGDSLLIDKRRKTPERYYPLARLLADDRLWVDSRNGRCTALFAVERSALNHERALSRDCGGRTPSYDAVNVCRSLLAGGKPIGIDDGLHRDETPTSPISFPFLAPTTSEPKN